MKTDKKIFLLILTFLALSDKSFGATQPGSIITKENPKSHKNLYVAAIATTGQENHHTFDYSTSTTPINSFIVAANGGKNDVTMKGDPTVGDKVVPNMKNFDGTDVLEPKNWTIEKMTGTGPINNNGKGKARYTLPSNKTDTGAVTLGDKSWTGENKITFENISIKGVNSDKVMFANQSMDTPNGMSDTTITFKGNNFLYEDGGKSHADEKDAVHFYKNTYLLPPTAKENVNSHTKFVSEPGSTLNMYVKSGPVKSRGIGVTQYKDVAFYAGKKYYINQTEMEFYGAVNIKIERGNQNRSENYGVFGSNMNRKMGGIGELPGSYNRINFYSDVKIDVKPVVDKNGNQLAIGDAINISDKDTHVGISGDGKVQINGDVHALNGATIDLNLKNKDSYINGEIHISKQKYGGDPDGDQSIAKNKPHGQNLFDENRDDPNDEDKNITHINLTMSNGARWNATNASKLTDLDLSSGATVTLPENIDSTVSIKNLKGTGGIFKVGVNLKEEKGDLIRIRNSSEGVHRIKAVDQAGADVNLTEKIKVVENVKDPDNNKARFIPYSEGVEMGPYIYLMGESNHSKLVNIDDDGKHDFYIFPSKELTPGAKSAMTLNDLFYQLNALNVDTLVQRMGEVHFDKTKTDYNIWSRYINGKYSGFEDLQDKNYKIPYWGSKVKNVHFEKVATKNNNIWVKNMEGQFTGIANSRTGSYSSRYRITKVGFDFERLRDNWINYGGIVFSNINSNTKFLSYEGKNEIKGMSLGLYSTWLHKEKNIYYDFVANMTNYKSRYDVISASGDPVHSLSPGSSDDFVHTTSFTFSAETGKRILLREEKDKTYYVQPEGQLVYQFTKGYKFNVSNGLRVSNGDLHGLLTRVGLRAGIDSKNKRFNSYVKLMYEAELLGNNKTVFNEKFEEFSSNKGHWLTYGVGLTATTKKGKQFYFEAQKSTKHKVIQDWQFNLGIRFNF